jgi:hypothetical protein
VVLELPGRKPGTKGERRALGYPELGKGRVQVEFNRPGAPDGDDADAGDEGEAELYDGAEFGDEGDDEAYEDAEFDDAEQVRGGDEGQDVEENEAG